MARFARPEGSADALQRRVGCQASGLSRRTIPSTSRHGPGRAPVSGAAVIPVRIGIDVPAPVTLDRVVNQGRDRAPRSIESSM